MPVVGELVVVQDLFLGGAVGARIGKPRYTF